MSAPISIRPYQPGDEAGLVACHNRVFPADTPGIDRQDAALWAWKFAANPTGLIQIVVADHEVLGIVGAYPCQPVRVWMDGAPRLGSQIVDLMVEARFRRSGGQPGLFVHCGRRFHELYCGGGRRGDRPADEAVRSAAAGTQQIFTYGWPVPAWRVGQKYLGYLNIRDWNLLFVEIDEVPGAGRALPAGLEVRQVERFGADVDALFERLKTDMGLTLYRDARYLNWRYAEHPHRRRYRLYECRARDDRELRGVSVYARGDFLRPNSSFLVDWLVRADDRDAICALVGTCERQASKDRTGVLAGVWSPIDPRFTVLQSMGYRLLDSRYFIVVSTFQYDTGFFRDHWIFTMGDSDLI